MATLPSDTSGLRAWLASQLKLEDVPEEIWEDLLEDGYVEDAQDPDLQNGRQSLLKKARRLLRIYRAGSGAPKTIKRQPTGKRQRAKAVRRAEVVAEIAAKIDKARASTNQEVSSDDGEDELRTPLREEWEQRLKRRSIELPKLFFADSPLVGEIRNSLITITAEPWVSPDDVIRRYEDLRSMWLWTPTPSERRVELVHFVAGYCDGYCNEEHGIVGLAPNESWPGWRELLDRWNERYPDGHDWHYTDVRNFRRDFLEAFETLTSYKDF
jgi:hypothetical protein